MEPFIIPIGTSNPVSICDGLPLFPTSAVRASVSGTSRSFSLFDVSATIFVTRLKTSAYAQYAFGVCGPAVAFYFPDVTVQRSNLNGEGRLELTFSRQDLEAGAFFGLSVGAGVNLAFQVYRPAKWYRPWEFVWADVFSASFATSIDLLALLADLIKALLSKGSKNSFEKAPNENLDGVLPSVIGTYMLTDATGGAGLEPELSVRPELMVPVNLVNFLPGFGNLNRALGKIGGEISIGPSYHIGLPVTFAMQSFTATGGLQGGKTEATYGSLTYHGNTVTATSNVQFNENATPTKLTTNVAYETGFSLGLSFHFRVTVAKMFNFEVNSPTLDFSKLLYGKSTGPVIAMEGSVSTGVQNSCLLVPDVALKITTLSGSQEVQTGDLIKGIVLLTEGYPGPTEQGNVEVSISPPLSGFPTRLTIQNGSKESTTFNYTFPNECLATGDPANPQGMTPPGPTNPLQTYVLTATVSYLASTPCSEYQVAVPLNVVNRYIRCQRASFATPGSWPPWDTQQLSGVTINAAFTKSPPSALPFATFSCWFPYLPGESPVAVPVRFTLLDEDRLPYTANNVLIGTSVTSAKLTPSTVLNVTPATAYNPNGSDFTLQWLSSGPHNEFSNRFFLVVDAGCAYGRTEVWLDVWNWS